MLYFGSSGDRVSCGRQVREIVRSPAGEPVSPLRSVKITARVGSLGGDVLVVPRRPTADSEVRGPAGLSVPGPRACLYCPADRPPTQG